MRRSFRRRRATAAALVPLALAATANFIPSAAGADAPSARMSVGARSASYGTAIRIAGSVSPTEGGQPVRIDFNPARGGEWSEVRTVSAAPNGAFATRIRVERSGEWRAVPNVGSPSAARRVVVRARLALARIRRVVMSGRRASFRGTVLPRRTGESVSVQMRRRGRWTTVDRARTRRGGRFTARWRAPRAGRYAVRAIYRGDSVVAGDRTGRRRLNVYRRSFASYYGPGFYGGRTACGQTLTPSTLGVAHKTLPCGTRVTFRNRGRAVTVRVIDRGPFAAGRDWDLTSATKRRLGFGSTGSVLSTR